MSGSNENFEAEVHAFVGDDDARARELADAFEAAVITVVRWAEGRARPHPRIQRAVLSWIRARREQ